jgi:endonuclease/exonuclease/phosphatase family metal-dependent hydrolase
MHISVGTFNVNNLFSRYNFDLQATVENLKPGKVSYTKIKNIVGQLESKPVDYKGIALHHKSPEERQMVVERIKTMDADVLALQEVEDIDTLRYFASTELGGLYPHVLLIEGNDPRLIDVAVMSKYPIGAATTWQTAEDPYTPDGPVFSRDMLQVEILNSGRKDRLFTLFVHHLKSHFVPFTEDQEEGSKQANERRRQQAETAALLLEKTMRPDSAYIVLGDMNDAPDSAFLRPLMDNFDLKLVNALTEATETQPAPKSTSPPATPLWTHRFKETGKPAQYELFDQIWLSPSLAPKLKGAHIARRTRMGGDGSDHDPVWVELEI